MDGKCEVEVMDLWFDDPTTKDIQTRFCMGGVKLLTNDDVEWLLFATGRGQVAAKDLRLLKNKGKGRWVD